jgi:hypothetical protein
MKIHHIISLPLFIFLSATSIQAQDYKPHIMKAEHISFYKDGEWGESTEIRAAIVIKGDHIVVHFNDEKLNYYFTRPLTREDNDDHSLLEVNTVDDEGDETNIRMKFKKDENEYDQVILSFNEGSGAVCFFVTDY